MAPADRGGTRLELRPVLGADGALRLEGRILPADPDLLVSDTFCCVRAVAAGGSGYEEWGLDRVSIDPIRRSVTILMGPGGAGSERAGSLVVELRLVRVKEWDTRKLEIGPGESTEVPTAFWNLSAGADAAKDSIWLGVHENRRASRDHTELFSLVRPPWPVSSAVVSERNGRRMPFREARCDEGGMIAYYGSGEAPGGVYFWEGGTVKFRVPRDWETEDVRYRFVDLVMPEGSKQSGRS